MGESLRKVCPCLETLWQRLYGDKKDGGGDENDGVGEQRVDSSNESSIKRYTGHREALKPPQSQSAESAIYTALWPFEARAQEELSFAEGDLFNVISRSGDWWTARRIDKNGRVLATGIVPNNYLARGESIDAQPWYFGKMNRFEALSHLLSPKNREGAFLIRLSENAKVGYVLSVKSSNRAKHFKILQKEEEQQYYVDQTHFFHTLMDLVEHYRTHSLGTIDGLGEACARKEPTPQDLSHSTVDEWELPKEEFTLEGQLGSGFFAVVHRGKWKGRVNVAIKILKNANQVSHTEFQREVQILKRLRHRHLISLFAVCTATPPYYIITELMEKGNLLDLLRGPEGRGLDTVFLVDMAVQVAEGMAYLESQSSIHRDLAARNVLVGENYICKVADFGLARVIKEPFYISEDKKIPYKWSAPEAISHGRFSNKSDVWSFGVLLYEILSLGGIPYPGYDNNEVYRQVTAGYRMPAPAKCPEHIYDIMRSCWSDAPEDRPHFKDLIPKLEKINCYELY